MSGRVQWAIGCSGSGRLSVVTRGNTHELAIGTPFVLVTTIRRSLRCLGGVLRMDGERLVLKTLIARTEGGTDYSPGSLFMDVQDIPFE